MDFNNFQNILNDLNGSNNDRRAQAEQILEQLPHQQRFSLLFQSMAHKDVPPNNAVMAAVLCRMVLRDHFDESYQLLSDEEKSGCRAQCLSLILQETIGKDLRQKYADVASKLAESLIDSDGNCTWNEFRDFIPVCATKSENADLREIALKMFTNIPSVFGITMMKQHLYDINTLFQRTLADPSLLVRIAAAKALGAFISEHDEDKEVHNALKNLIPGLLQVIHDSLQADVDDSTALSVLVDISDTVASYLRPSLVPVLELCFSVLTRTGEPEMDDSQRHLALEVIISLSENLSAAMRKSGAPFLNTLVAVLFKMIADVEDEENWSQNDNPEEDDEMSNTITGETSLDRLSCALGGKVILPLIIKHVPAMLKSADWRERYAALMSVSSCGEGCHRQMEAMLGDVLQGVVPMLNDPHPRVRYAACNAVGQMSTDFAPKLQKSYHALVLPALMHVLDDEANPRVQGHAAAAIVNFAENCDKGLLELYLDTLVNKLGAIVTARYQDLIQQNRKLVLEQVVTTIAAIADAAQEKFAPHYSKFVPGLKHIIQNATSTELRVLRGKTIECVSLMALAVGREIFLPDSAAIIDLLLKAQIQLDQEEGKAADDPQASYMISAWARICRLLGRDFEPFLPSVMKPLMKVAAQKPDCAIMEDEEKPDETDSSWQMVKLSENQNFAINTSCLEDKATACSLLVCYAKEIQAGFLPYCDEVTTLMLELLRFYFSDDVRSSAAECLPHLLRVAKCRSHEYLWSIWARVAPELLRAIDSEPEREVLGDVYNSLAQSIEIMGRACLSVEQLQKLASLLDNSFVNHFQRHEERLAKRHDEDYDEEEEQRLIEEKSDDEYILGRINEVTRALLSTHNAEILPWYNQLQPHVMRLMSADATIEDFKWGLCFLDDLLEHLGAGSEPYKETILKNLETGLHHSDPGVCQAALYGVGVAAMHGSSPEYTLWIQAAFPRVIQMIEHEGARSEDYMTCTDNAISAIAKIMRHKPDALPQGVTREQLLPRWLQWLPLQEDEEEGEHVYGFVCDLLDANDPIIMANSSQIIPHLIKCFAHAFNHALLKEDKPTYARTVQIIRQVQQNAQDMFNVCCSSLDEAELKCLQKALQPPA